MPLGRAWPLRTARWTPRPKVSFGAPTCGRWRLRLLPTFLDDSLLPPCEKRFVFIQPSSHEKQMLQDFVESKSDKGKLTIPEYSLYQNALALPNSSKTQVFRQLLRAEDASDRASHWLLNFWESCYHPEFFSGFPSWYRISILPLTNITLPQPVSFPKVEWYTP